MIRKTNLGDWKQCDICGYQTKEDIETCPRCHGKTLEEVQATVMKGVYVIPSEEFKHSSFNGFDGDGFFHDGLSETDISVWYDPALLDKYAYVCWYNK